ncbi:hypothetical protein niasHS_009201 [Heterodera schachtii]|uniref:Uncharacterized protein n=1 Tax=Heterodera schachtii TaxID=97005 RepID=A0ABD2J4Y3_HETSC
MDNLHHISTATSSMVSSSNLSSIIESPDVSQHITFKGASPPDTSQHSIRMPQYVPPRKNAENFQTKMNDDPAPVMPDKLRRKHNLPNPTTAAASASAGVVPLNNSQWISHILDQQHGDTDQHQQREETQLVGRRLSSMRSMWEDRISEESEQKQHEEQVNAALFARRKFLFPKWRSVDPLTASLVASHKTPEMIPVDSRIPQYRHQSLMETERMAPYAKLELHKPYIEQEVSKQLQKDAKRMFVPARPKNPEEMAQARACEILYRQKAPWYNLDEIRQQISHESIANVGTTRQMFEHQSIELSQEEREIQPRRPQQQKMQHHQNAVENDGNGTFYTDRRSANEF